MSTNPLPQAMLRSERGTRVVLHGDLPGARPWLCGTAPTPDPVSLLDDVCGWRTGAPKHDPRRGTGVLGEAAWERRWVLFDLRHDDVMGPWGSGWEAVVREHVRHLTRGGRTALDTVVLTQPELPRRELVFAVVRTRRSHAVTQRLRGVHGPWTRAARAASSARGAPRSPSGPDTPDDVAAGAVLLPRAVARALALARWAPTPGSARGSGDGARAGA